MATLKSSKLLLLGTFVFTCLAFGLLCYGVEPSAGMFRLLLGVLVLLNLIFLVHYARFRLHPDEVVIERPLWFFAKPLRVPLNELLRVERLVFKGVTYRFCLRSGRVLRIGVSEFSAPDRQALGAYLRDGNVAVEGF